MIYLWNTTNYDAMDIFKTFKAETDQLINMLANISEEEMNKIPNSGGWSAAQVADHLYRSYEIVGLLKGEKKETNRLAAEKFSTLENIFLDYEAKYDSPVEILPAKGNIKKEELLNRLRERTNQIEKASNEIDLSQLCMASEFPGLGYMTVMEWLYFSAVHTKRHTRQIHNILNNQL